MIEWFGNHPWATVALIWAWAISRIIWYPHRAPDAEVEVKRKGRKGSKLKGFVATIWDWTH